MVHLKPLTFNQAYALRAQLYRLRKKLIKEGHEVAANAREATIKLYTEKSAEQEYFVLTVHPKSMGFEAAFAAAGIEGSSDEEEPPPLD